MIHRDRSAGRLLAIGAGLLVAVIVLTPWPVRTATVPIIEPVLETALVRPATPAGATRAPAAPTGTKRTRIVRVNSYSLPTPGTSARAVEDDLELALFPGVTLRATFDRFETVGRSGTWIGHVEGSPLSSVALAYRDGLMTGNINTLEASYQIQPAADVQARDGDPRPLHVVSEIDLSALPSGPDTPPAENPAIPANSPPQTRGLDSGDVIDVMVLYTPAAMARAGGTAGVQNSIALQVAETNGVYANSKMNLRIRLVYQGLINYAETPNFGRSLADLRDGLNGLSGVTALRDAVGADLVALLVELLPNASACGIGHFAAFPGMGERYGVAVLGDAICRSAYVMAHEFGHNMGARHDWYVDSSLAPWSFGHGHVDLAGGWRTVMSYGDLCNDSGINCPLIPFFSTPDLEYIPLCGGGRPYDCNLLRYWFFPGRPIGIREGQGVNCQLGIRPETPCSADNRRVINDTAFTVANFRQSR